MSRAAATELLDALDPLPYSRRVRELAAHARSAAGRGELSGLLDGLEQHGTYGQRLAVLAACAARDGDHLAARLTHPDPVVRGHARRAAAAPGGGIGDDALGEALHDAPAAVRAPLLRLIVNSGRTALADRLVDVLRARRGDAEAARLLPGCGAETVARLLPGLFHAAGARRALAARHPDALLAEAERQLAALPEAMRHAWWDRYGAGVAHTARQRPLRVLELLELYRESAPLTAELLAQLGTLAAADPARTLRLLLAPGHAEALRERGLPPGVLRRLVRADPPGLPELGRAWSGHPRRLAELLRALPPGRRAGFFDTATESGEHTRRVLDEEVLHALPHARREQEARRAARQAREREAHWTTVLAALAHLPDEDSRAELAAATRRPAAEDRARAWPLLIRQAANAAVLDGGRPARVTALLADLERLREEQDPVRSAALTALAALPPRLFGEEAADHLDGIATDAVRAPDSSPETRGALGRLAQSLLREHAAGGERALTGWALRIIVRLSGHTGDADLGRLDRTLPRGREHAVYEALRPWLEAGAEKVDHGLTFALARALGRRAAGMPELQELLWQAVQFGTEPTARTAVGLWLGDPRTRDTRAAQVLKLDRSAAVLPAVARTLARRRTDLLDTVLGDTPPYGRFLSRDATAGDALLPSVGPDAGRWLPRQQRAAARLLAHEADDASRPMALRRTALERLAHLSDEGARELRLWAGDPGEEAEPAHAAMRALVRSDRPGEALPVLLAHLAGDRARTAVPALHGAARYVAPSRLSGVLHELLLPGTGSGSGAPDGASAATKVTGSKAAARLAAARLPVAEAAELLAAAAELPGAHPDLRAVCVACTPRLLDDERAWQLVTTAVRDAPVLRHAVLRTRPLELPERHRERYAGLVTGLCEVAGPDDAEAVYGALARWAPWAPGAAGVLAAAVTDLTDRGTWRQAAEGLVELVTVLPGSAGTLDEVLTRLVAADGEPGTPDAQPGRDRPARRRVEHLALTVGDRARHHRTARQAAERAGELLAAHEEFVPSAVRLLSRALDPEADGETLGEQLRGIAGLHAGRPGLAWRTAEELRRSLRPADRAGSGRERLLPVARALAADGGHATGLLAVTLAAVVNPGSGWPEPWRGFLREARRHDVPDVRAAALEVATDPGE